MTTMNSGQPTNAALAETYAPIPTTANYGQYAPSPWAPGPYAPSPYAPPAVDPARALGVVGLVLSFIVGAVGLVLSAVAFRTSRRAGFRNVPALVGMVVGSLGTIAVVIALVVGGVAAKGLVDTCQDLGPGSHTVNGVTYTCS